MRVGLDSAVAMGGQQTWDVSMTRPEGQAEPASTADLAAADDQAVVQAFLAGRREAFDVIVERHRRQVYQLCYRFTGNHEDASDLAQDVFVRAFRGLKNFKGQASLGTWLYRIGVNASLNRAAVKRPPTEPIEPERHVDTASRDPLLDLVR